MALPQEPFYTLEDIYALPDGKRAELLDGQIYNMAPPSRVHQEIVQFMTKNIGYHIDKKNGSCKVYPAPFAVFLTKDNSNYVEPDVSCNSITSNIIDSVQIHSKISIAGNSCNKNRCMIRHFLFVKNYAVSICIA